MCGLYACSVLALKGYVLQNSIYLKYWHLHTRKNLKQNSKNRKTMQYFNVTYIQVV